MTKATAPKRKPGPPAMGNSGGGLLITVTRAREEAAFPAPLSTVTERYGGGLRRRTVERKPRIETPVPVTVPTPWPKGVFWQGGGTTRQGSGNARQHRSRGLWSRRPRNVA